MERVIITGGRGFLGRSLEKKLREEFEVTIFDIEDGKDITRPEDFNELKADYVVHLAALLRGVKDKDLIKVNIAGTTNVLEFCKNTNARLVFASSAAVYGDASSPINEEEIVNPISIYGQTKAAGENACRRYFDKYNTQSTILRIFNMYGPGQQKGLLIPDILSRIGQEEIKLWNPNSKRDFIHVKDIVEAVRKSLDLQGFNTINIGTGKSYSVREIAEKILNGRKIEYIQEGKDSDIYADIHRAERTLNWKPKVCLEEGLKEILI